MSEQADVMTLWTTLNGNNHPQVDIDHTLVSWEDFTVQPPDAIPPEPNNYVVHITAETVDMDAIAADVNYTIMQGTRGGA